jgi:amino acid transporter
MCIIVALTKNYDVFVGGDFGNEKYKTFITGYLGIPIYLILIFGHKLIMKTRGWAPHEVDFYTGKDIIDREENEFLARKAALKEAKGPNRGGWFYKTFVSWLF